MINLNLQFSTVEKKISTLQTKVEKIHQMIIDRTGEGNEMLDWYNWANVISETEINSINFKIKNLKAINKVDILLVIGIGGSFLGAKAGIDFVKGSLKNQEKVIFAGTNISGDYIKQLEEKLEGKNWAICVISKSGATLEPAIAFRHFSNLLEKKVGIKKLQELVVVITDKDKGLLNEIVTTNGYQKFVIPNGIGGRFSGITAVGLFPMAFVGIDIKQILSGVKKAMEDLKSENLNKNVAYRYAAARNLLYKKRYYSDIFVSYEPDHIMFGEWWKQLFGESEGKNEKALFPNSVTYTRDLHSLGQFIQEGKKTFFETVFWQENHNQKIKIEKSKNDFDKLNYLENKTIDYINKQAFNGILKAHYEDGKVPNIIISFDKNDEKTLGYIWYFFFVSVTMSAYLLGVNPFNQPGVDIYKKYMNSNLKKN